MSRSISIGLGMAIIAMLISAISFALIKPEFVKKVDRDGSTSVSYTKIVAISALVALAVFMCQIIVGAIRRSRIPEFNTLASLPKFY